MYMKISRKAYDRHSKNMHNLSVHLTKYSGSTLEWKKLGSVPNFVAVPLILDRVSLSHKYGQVGVWFMTENIDRILPANFGKEACDWITFYVTSICRVGYTSAN